MKYIAASIIVVLILSVYLPLYANTTTFSKTRTLSVLPIHNLDTNISYATIQEAIDANATIGGHRILVDAGVYHETLVVDKSIALIGENKTTTIIEGSGRQMGDGNVEIAANNTVFTGFTVRNTYQALRLSGRWGGPFSFISGVNVSDVLMINCTTGLNVESSVKDSYFENNEIVENDIGILGSSNNNFLNNTIANNIFGTYMSPYNQWRNNSLVSNTYNFLLELNVDAQALDKPSDIDPSNKIDGKPIYYFHNQSDLLINPSTFPQVGYLALVNCSNAVVRNLTLSSNGQGIFLSKCTNCTIENCILSDNLEGIYALADQMTVLNNTIRNNLIGMIVRGIDNKLLGNALKNNTVRLSPYYLPESWSFNQISDWIADQAISLSSGITLYGGGNNTIVDNQIDDGEQGILFWKTQGNLFRNNSMNRNVHNFGTYINSLYPAEWVINPPNQSRISPYLMQDIDLSNTVDGKPIYWWINARNVSVPEDAGFVALINCTEIIVQNLQLHNNTQGILMVDATNVTVRDNSISEVRSGILVVRTPLSLNHCENNTLTSNSITASGLGIFSYQSTGIVSNNRVSGNLYGIFDEGNHSSISENIISNCTCPPMDQWVLGWVAEHFEPMTVNLGLSTGLILAGSNGTISRNTISHNDQGVSLLSYGWGGDNRIFHNNFIENGKHVGQQFTSDAFGYEWDDGYPIGGNYWSGMEFSDEYSGSYQNETGSDGIADSVFFVSQNMTDDYPLTAPITTFERTLNNETCVFDIISNSTVMDFTLDTTENTISFNISGESGEGFCRISIPALVMQGLFGGNCTVLVDGNPVEYNSRTDAGYTYVYFSYHLSQHEITIVSEYEFLPQLLSVMATVMILAIAKTKFQKKTSSRYL